MCRQNRAGFTLVELLVVVGTVAVLAAMLLPAIAGTRPNGIVFQCLENQKRLGQAFLLYAGDNNGKIVASRAKGQPWDAGGYWGPPKPDPYGGSSPWTNSAQALASIQSSMMTNNLLYPYAPGVGVYHCPGDARFNFPVVAGQTPVKWAYDSYSKTDNVGGENSNGQGSSYTNIASIKTPSNTFAFLEDADSRGYNVGTFVVHISVGSLPSISWCDPFAMYHGAVTTACFADGHAEAHTWHNSRLIRYGKEAATGTYTTWNGYDLGGPIGIPSSDQDFSFVYGHFLFPRHE